MIERDRVTADDTFGMPVTASHVTNRKLRGLAEELVETA